jgi:hypothetical protein
MAHKKAKAPVEATSTNVTPVAESSKGKQPALILPPVSIAKVILPSEPLKIFNDVPAPLAKDSDALRKRKQSRSPEKTDREGKNAGFATQNRGQYEKRASTFLRDITEKVVNKRSKVREPLDTNIDLDFLRPVKKSLKKTKKDSEHAASIQNNDSDAENQDPEVPETETEKTSDSEDELSSQSEKLTRKSVAQKDDKSESSNSS